MALRNKTFCFILFISFFFFCSRNTLTLVSIMTFYPGIHSYNVLIKNMRAKIGDLCVFGGGGGD